MSRGFIARGIFFATIACGGGALAEPTRMDVRRTTAKAEAVSTQSNRKAPGRTVDPRLVFPLKDAPAGLEKSDFDTAYVSATSKNK